jgi:hypothetical protein
VDFRRYLKCNYFSGLIPRSIGENCAQIGHEFSGDYSDIHLIDQGKTMPPTVFFKFLHYPFFVPSFDIMISYKVDTGSLNICKSIFKR